MKDGGRWLKDGKDDDRDGVSWFYAVWGVLIRDGQTDRIMDIGKYRVAFVTENGKKNLSYFQKARNSSKI